MKTLIGTFGDSEKLGGDEDTVVFNHAMKVSRRMVGELIVQSQKHGKSSHFRATLFMFIVVWSLVGHILKGVESSDRKFGKRNEVAKLWHLMRIGFASSGDVERTMAKLETFEKDFEGGKFDDYH
jgi:hypothetical protein